MFTSLNPKYNKFLGICRILNLKDDEQSCAEYKTLHESVWPEIIAALINGWQTLLGGLFLLPFALFFYKPQLNHYDTTFWMSVAWLAVPVSIVAVQLWLWLLQTDAVKAGLWLFLCPLFGF